MLVNCSKLSASTARIVFPANVASAWYTVGPGLDQPNCCVDQRIKGFVINFGKTSKLFRPKCVGTDVKK